MAKKKVVRLVDDLDGNAASESVEFSFDGVDYAIDLSAVNARRLRDSLAAYVAKATRLSGRRRPGDDETRTAVAPDRGGSPGPAIRCRSEQVNDRGRIPAELAMRYQQARSRS
jgi:hypothetical protein